MLGRGLRILIEGAGNGTASLLTVGDYISFVTMLLVIFGAAFELPLLLVMANRVGVLPAKLLKKSQRVAIFLIFLFAGVATPTADPFTMCAMAIPMVILFEIALLVCHFHDKRKAERKAAEAAERAAAHPDDSIPSVVDPIPQQLEGGLPADERRGDAWFDTT